MKNILRFALIIMPMLYFSMQANAQLLPTNLRVTVIDDLGNVQPGARVTLYASEEDYLEDKNGIEAPELTDTKGRVKIKGLKSRSYFIKAVKGDKDNSDGATKTGKLKEKKTNMVNVIIKEF